MNKREVLRIETDLNEESIEKEKGELLSEFNFELQRNIIRSFTERAGIKEPHLITREMIRDYKGEEFAHYVRKGDIEYLGINFQKLLKVEPDPTKRKLLFWHILNHEQIHAVSSDANGTLGYQPSGFPLLVLWNEGITEIVGRTITREFYVTNGYSKAEIRGGYQVPVEFVELVARKIGEATGVGSKIALEAIINGMLLKEDSFLDGSLEELFSDILPPNFLSRLPIASSKDMGELIENLKPKEFESALQVKDPNVFKNFFNNLIAELRKVRKKAKK